MITWRLNEVMEKLGIKPVALAKELGVSATTISNYRKAQPSLSKEGWNDLLNALNRMRRADSNNIGLCDLVDYTFVKEEKK